MIIMDKFEKRIQKLKKNLNHVLVIGAGFGKIKEILNICGTVFVINDRPLDIKSKKLIYRETFDSLAFVPDLSLIIVDLEKINHLNDAKEYWVKNKSLVVIEGNSPIEREFSKPLYDSGWRCYELQGFFHVWEKMR